ncbi:MAG: glycerol kinase GlpK [Verrucomicrobia bacterium]|jgi:glycerol kinase|nr:glycerol kinase GlpK [Verrucomicrobiota bacterium]OQC66727.1 MAG: Glycerol kinase [Verrucomicrobia bacterium ADurb.Bin006]MDI9381615.1 glycerol kinase GlpK [Verrucomicrobiota bacterium]NMD20382.1 glycerol kinase GlpK [Verrucomicrobiota bacterium]HNU98773.1 glycerol kinase GlpK [Verrucomicrobiota bacterium]
MKAILALDQGTTSSRAIVFDHDGSPRGLAQKEFKQSYPQAGWVEHDPREIWESQLATAREALAQAGLEAGDIAAIGITNQRETTVVWDRRTGEPVHPAIVWQDRRTARFCDDLKRAGHETVIQAKAGLVIDAYFSGSKLRWILDRVPGARERAARGDLAFGTIDTWLLWRMTNGALHLTDPSNASRTMLYNLDTGDWDDELLGILGVPREVLPHVRSSSEVYGETADGVFGAPIPIAGIAGDQQAALFGQNCFESGQAKNTYGTGCFMLMNVGTKPVASRHRLVSTVAWQAGGRTDFALEGSVFIGGAVVQWLRDGLGLIKSSAEIERLAATVPDCGDVYLVPAFAGLGAPHWDQYARGTITGLTRGTTAGHLARAALESIAFQVADVLDVMRQDSGVPIHELRADGGACANDLLMQFQSDILRARVARPKVIETTALGAAYLAGLAVGFWKDRAEVERAWQIDRVFEPRMSADEAAHRRDRWTKALRRALDWEEHSMRDVNT